MVEQEISHVEQQLFMQTYLKRNNTTFIEIACFNLHSEIDTYVIQILRTVSESNNNHLHLGNLT